MDGNPTFIGQKAYECPKHGYQGLVVGIEVEVQITVAVPPFAAKRQYCMACWIDHMDAHLCQLVEVPPRAPEETG